MEKITDGELYQTQKTKNFNLKLWLSIISAVLSFAMIAIVCLGVALFESNNKIAVLRTELNDANEKIEELEELDVPEELEGVANEYAQVSEELKLSRSEQESLEEQLNAFEKANKEAQEQIDLLKNDSKNAADELAALKEQLAVSDDKIRIYIDQGHNPTSYHNSGTTCNGLYEEDLTFLIGSVLANMLKADGRFEVKLSRPNKSVVLGTDNNSSLKARVDGAAEFNADYFISLHVNSYERDTNVSGIEVYVADESGESCLFAETLLEGLIESTNMTNRDVKPGPDLYVLKNSTMPAVLVEMGFITNNNDAELLSEHPELFAQGIYNGILEYFGYLPNMPVTA